MSSLSATFRRSGNRNQKIVSRRKARHLARKTRLRNAKARKARAMKIRPNNVRDFVGGLFGGDLHAKRVESIANGVTGVLHAAVLAIHAIGQAYARVAGIAAKSGVKQVDRFLSNTGIAMVTIFALWVAFIVGVRKQIVIALDWTEFDKDDHATLCAYLVTRHGRATPLVWRSVPEV